MRRRRKRRPLFGAEVAPKRLPVRLSAQCGRELIPGPISGTGLAHRQLDRLLSDAPGIGSRLDQLLNRCRHTTNRGIFYGTIQGCTLRRVGPVSGLPLCPAREAHDRNNASRLGTAKPAVSCDLATRTNNASTTHEPTWWLFATSSPTHLPRPSGSWPRAGRGVGGLPRQGR